MRNLSIRKMNELLKGKKSGFTLVELIIVIAIIAILAAIAIPKFGEIRNSANDKADIATAKNIATVVAARIADGTDPTTFDGKTVGTASGNLDLTNDIDGGTTPKLTGKTSFRVEVTNGNIQVFYDAETTNPVYPE